ncbi:terminase TerL endonuclease subunit [Cloacibacillus sp. An23]|uniref:terminase large subunit n=1 Tax=Cloacibacillus sp. An23 TaxID=1965591 RepID=UPI000B3AC5E5|nr:terminase TerL endonuclease subunit [Cloacibacillus sp. An23]OUO91835.1 hypothetical protein B5F39_11925 [Cloacibacillus sp. An23]
MRLLGAGRPRENSIRWARRYIDCVVNEKIPVCRWVRLAVERHINDLKSAGRRGYYFDEKQAERVLKFFSFLHHSKGEFAGRPFVLSTWEQFIVYTLYGWRRKKDGLRRFRTAYLEVARKNGKSTFAAGNGLFLLDGDGEPGAEIYVVATKREQAKIVFSEAQRMVRSSPELKKFITVNSSSMFVLDSASKFEPLGSDKDTLDGLNVHGGIIDELHAHKTRDVYDLIDTATGARRQPLLFSITTAGVNQNGICREKHNHTEKILQGVIPDDEFFGMIFTLDDGDDWQDELNWMKPNPNLGVSVEISDLRRKARYALSSPAALNPFLRLHMNVWTSAESVWITPDKWNETAGEVNASDLTGCECYGGLDLSTTTDISALTLTFPQPDGTYKNIYEFWVPKDRIEDRVRRDRVPYDVWVRDGVVHATEGSVIDYDFIEHRILELARRYRIRELAYDPYNATEITNHLIDHGIEMVKFQQGFLSISPAAKQLEILIMSKKYHHGGNPVMNWMMSNVVIRQDPAGNIKLDKEKSREKIDGPVSAVMAIGRATTQGGNAPSIYEMRGVVAI